MNEQIDPHRVEAFYQAVRQTIDDLTAAWTRFNIRNRGYNLSRPTEKAAPARYLAVLGLGAHVFSASAQATVLLDPGNGMVAGPLVRLMFEAGVTAVWVAEHEGAWQGFFNESSRQKRNLLKGMASVVPGEDLDQLNIDLELDDTHDDPARHFERRCHEFTRGEQLYAHYRMLSAVCHAGAVLSDPYLSVAPNGQVTGFHENPDPALDPHQIFTWLAGVSLHFAVSAVAAIATNDVKGVCCTDR